jgi:hypothetical protein
MALSAGRTYETVGPMVRIQGQAASSDTYYKGALLAFNSDGYLAVPSDAANVVPAGVYTGHGVDAGDDSLTVGSGENPTIEVERGLIWVAHSGAAQTDVGATFFVTDDDTVADSASSANWEVLCVGYKPGYLLLDFGHPMKS